ncbi:hypothetical protein GCM10009785_31050 [Brooklawnia cerclae]|uniref:Polyketide synthase PksL n=1 Tax=Brooklawnia cerclae TaxID=349934 RepID=A0ABX0SE18_9ACTN|nr:type I polyketide synthase [Brooklawnia cerclae]NIH56604.1 polyketide synthase PksL [Brooklawnia cerclae]
MDRLEIFARLASKTISKSEALALLKDQAAEPEPAPEAKPPRRQADAAEAVAESVRACVAGVLHIDAAEVADELSFSEMGVDSISGLEIVRDLNVRHSLNLDSTVLYDFPHVTDLAGHVAEQSRSSRGTLTATAEPAHQAPAGRPNGREVRAQVARIVADVLHLDPGDLDPQLTFQEMGFDSISGLEMVRDANTRFGLNLDSVVIYDHPDIDQLSSHIAGLLVPAQTPASPKADDDGAGKTVNPFESDEVKGVYHDAHFGDMRRKFLEETVSRDMPRPDAPSHGQESRTRPKVALRTTPPTGTTTSPPTATPVTGPDGRGTGGRVSDALTGRIAVVGMAGVFPDAHDVDAFWDNLVSGLVSMRPVPQGRWNNTLGVQAYDETIRPALLDDIESFDPLFFNISPIDAEVMDPQQRIFLEVAHQAFDDAGYPENKLSGERVGVFVGAAMGDYQKRFDGVDVANQSQVFAGNASSILPARISYYLDLRGPSMVIDTACSSSLVAVHQACQSLRTGEVDMALAGGIRVMVTDELYVQARNAGMVSPSGECRAFDEKADGIAMGEAAGAVVLKRHEDALADGDRVYGVILGSGINQDGHTNGITAPSPRAQTELEVEVYERYHIDPREITLIEAHGTGTALGDPIEVKALRETFSRYTDEAGFCELGSVKNNIGHTTMAAGISSLIKVLKAMEHGSVPPLANFERLNPKINLAGGPFRIETEPHAWDPPRGMKRTAALSSFGFSGTNCHLVIQEA